MKTRRRFLAGALSAATASAALGLRPRWLSAGEPSPVKHKPDVVIYEGDYPGWPWITAGTDGRLYCAFREGAEHGLSSTGKAMIAVSGDRGKSWSPARTIVDEPGIDDRNVAVAALPSGDLLVSYNTYNAAKESLAMTVRSTDGGQSWAAPRPVGMTNTRTKSAVIVLSKHRLLLPYYIAPGSGALAALSKDDGQTWKTVRVPDAAGFLGDEWDVLQLEPGRLVGIFRNNHPTSDGTFWKSESRDSGQTWSVPRATNVRSRRHNSPAQLTRHAGAPTLIYSDQRMVSVSAVTTSDPELLRWDVAHRLPCYVYNADERPIVDGSYPVSVQVGPSERLVVDYEIRPDSKRITGYFVTFPENWGQ